MKLKIVTFVSDKYYYFYEKNSHNRKRFCQYKTG